MAYKDSLQPSISFLQATTSPTTTSSPAAQLTSPLRPSSSSINSILSVNMERKPQFDIRSTLMSPPEPAALDTFSRPKHPPQTALFSNPLSTFPLSPPVSPYIKADVQDDSPSLPIKDPILYPQPDPASASSQPPLFDESDALATQRLVKGHMAARDSDIFREASPPRLDEYQLALEFKSSVAKAYNANRSLWFRRERQFLLDDRAIRSNSGKRYAAIAPHPRGNRAIKPNNPTTLRTPKSNIVRSTKPVRSSPPKPVRATTPGETTGKIARTDKDFLSIPDYCPPISSLPNKANSLKVDWRGAPIELRGDPHYNHLHPDEVSLAANLRLDCATYLTSKRRIFERRLECLRIGKEFRKTDAQQACKIDVNKASKLWQAFDKVGWLDASWVRKYL